MVLSNVLDSTVETELRNLPYSDEVQIELCWLKVPGR